jgi:hypothetical protein
MIVAGLALVVGAFALGFSYEEASGSDIAVLTGLIYGGLFLAIGGLPWRNVQFLGMALLCAGAILAVLYTLIQLGEAYSAWSRIPKLQARSAERQTEIRALYPRVIAEQDPQQRSSALATYNRMLADLTGKFATDVAQSRQKAAEDVKGASIAVLWAVVYAAGAWQVRRHRRQAAQLHAAPHAAPPVAAA